MTPGVPLGSREGSAPETNANGGPARSIARSFTSAAVGQQRSPNGVDSGRFSTGPPPPSGAADRLSRA